MSDFEIILLIIGATAALSVVFVIWERRMWEKSDEPWRYNPEMTMEENGRAHDERERVLAARRLEKAKNSKLNTKSRE